MIYASIFSKEKLYNSNSHQDSLCLDYNDFKVKAGEIALIFQGKKLPYSFDFFRGHRESIIKICLYCFEERDEQLYISYFQL